jgi:hypothetical protein
MSLLEETGTVIPASGGGGFDPEGDVTSATLHGWCDLSDASTLYTDRTLTTLVSNDGDALRGVADKSSEGNDFAAHSNDTFGGLYKTNQQNGLSSCQSDGSTSLVTSLISPQLEQKTVHFIAAKLANTTGFQTLFEGAVGRQFLRSNNSTSYQIFAGTVQSYGTPDTSPHIHVVEFDAGDSNAFIDDGSDLVATSPGTAGIDRINLFGFGSIELMTSGGQIYEYLMYQGNMSVSDIDAVRSYLNSKWSIF